MYSSSQKRKPVRTAPVKGGAPSNLDRDLEDVGEELPSFARLTAQGGYAHTTSSRRKIGVANRGNTPWNKGTGRTQSEKARIGAAVRARNAAILAANLEKMGMTEAEYKKHRLELRYMRERLRKIKVLNNERLINEKQEREKLEEFEKQQTLLLPLQVEEIYVEEIVYEEEEVPLASEIWDQLNKEEENLAFRSSKAPPLQPHQADSDAAAVDRMASAALTTAGNKDKEQEPNQVPVLTETDDKDNGDDDDKDKDNARVSRKRQATTSPLLQLPNSQHMPSVFRKDIHWGSNYLDDPNVSYSQFCPKGGPGGLICCPTCSSLYSDYLLDTHHNLETQNMERVQSEVSMISNFLTETTARLRQSMEAAKRQPPPLIKKIQVARPAAAEDPAAAAAAAATAPNSV